jgi:hypothetical protein
LECGGSIAQHPESFGTPLSQSEGICLSASPRPPLFSALPLHPPPSKTSFHPRPALGEAEWDPSANILNPKELIEYPKRISLFSEHRESKDPSGNLLISWDLTFY